MARLLLILACCLLPTLVPAQDRVLGKDGVERQGELLAQDEQGVRIRLADGKELQVPHAKIRAVLPAGQAPDIYAPQAPALEEAARKPPKTYIRYAAGDAAKQERGTLSTGISRWLHKASGTTIFQVGVVHIAEQPYYDRLQRILDHCDLVLFEGVGKGEVKGEELQAMSALGKMQVLMNNALGLRFQKRGIDYQRGFWRRADVDFAELRAELDKNGAALPTDSPVIRFLVNMVTRLVGDMKNQGESKGALAMRAQLAPILAQADQILATKMKAMGNAVINFRNARVIELLEKELKAGVKGRWVAVFYGAGHMPDLDRRLERLGCVYQGVDWQAAWHFPARPQRRKR